MQLVRTDEGDRSAETRAVDMNRMFNNMLRAWAMDVLSLRQRGLDRPSLRSGRGRAESARPKSRKAA